MLMVHKAMAASKNRALRPNILIFFMGMELYGALNKSKVLIASADQNHMNFVYVIGIFTYSMPVLSNDTTPERHVLELRIAPNCLEG